MKTRILTVYEKLFDAEAREVILPGCDGEVCVLDFHQPFLYRLRSGYVKVKPVGPGTAAQGGKFFIRDGVAAMKDNALDILIER